MITNIKIFGERNSGTIFLRALLQNNIQESEVHPGNYINKTGWKHGFPHIEYFPQLDKTLFIFIIRDLDSWIMSMYNNPYHFKQPDTIEAFIHNKLTVIDARPDHDVHKYKRERQNIINLRYDKIREYMKFFSNVPHAIFINLADLQSNNTKFLHFLRDTYKLKLRNLILKVEHHTKNKDLKVLNRTYDQTLPVIPNKDEKLEQFVESLKDKYVFKSGV